MDVSSVIRPPSTTQPRPWPSVSWQTAAKVAATTPTATTVVKSSERPTALRAAISEDLSDLVSLISDFSHFGSHIHALRRRAASKRVCTAATTLARQFPTPPCAAIASLSHALYHCSKTL